MPTIGVGRLRWKDLRTYCHSKILEKAGPLALQIQMESTTCTEICCPDLSIWIVPRTVPICKIPVSCPIYHWNIEVCSSRVNFFQLIHRLQVRPQGRCHYNSWYNLAEQQGVTMLHWWLSCHIFYFPTNTENGELNATSSLCSRWTSEPCWILVAIRW